MRSPDSDGVAGMPTGPDLCARIASADLRTVSDEELLELLNAGARQLNYQQAQQWQIMAEIADRAPANLPDGSTWTPDKIFDSAAEEIRAELRLTRRSAERELVNAAAVIAQPRIAAALQAGAIDRVRAIVLSDGCLDLTDAQSGRLLDELLPQAGAITATWLAEKVQKIAIALDPRWAERRYKQAVRERRVVGYLNRDGSATVSGQNLPADEASAACARVDALASAAKRAGAAAKIDHLRAELFLGLLDGRFHGLSESAIVDALVLRFPKPTAAAQASAPTSAAEGSAEAAPAPRAAALAAPGVVDAGTVGIARGVHLRVQLGTLLGLDDRPGEIAGWGYIPASSARNLAAQQRGSEWRFAIVDAEGQDVFDGVTRRRPRGEGAGRQAHDGIVELHVSLALLNDHAVAAAHPQWAALLTDLSAQYAAQRPIEQDPDARFAGRPLRRRTQTKFKRCIFPGCRRPASECDLDHRHDWGLGGRTEEGNLAPPCRHDHMLKTEGGWRLVRRDDHTFVWTSPLGRKHIVRTEPTAPPLPDPIPRPLRPEVEVPDTGPDPPPPIFVWRTRRDRPLMPEPTAAPVGAAAFRPAPDPPPF